MSVQAADAADRPSFDRVGRDSGAIAHRQLAYAMREFQQPRRIGQPVRWARAGVARARRLRRHPPGQAGVVAYEAVVVELESGGEGFAAVLDAGVLHRDTVAVDAQVLVALV
jgi:hypothetical protein